MLRRCAYRASCHVVTLSEELRARAWLSMVNAGMDPDNRIQRRTRPPRSERGNMAVRRAFPWKTAFLGIGIVLTIGGGMLFVSTPALGGWIVGFGLLALIGGACVD